jgi:hypothetical protein
MATRWRRSCWAAPSRRPPTTSSPWAPRSTSWPQARARAPPGTPCSFALKRAPSTLRAHALSGHAARLTTYACGGASPWCMTLVMRWSAAVPRGTKRVASATCVNQAAETGGARRRLPAAARGRRRGRGRAHAARPLAGAAVAGAVDAGAAAGRAAARARAARAGAASRRPQPIARSARGCWAPHARRNALWVLGMGLVYCLITQHVHDIGIQEDRGWLTYMLSVCADCQPAPAGGGGPCAAVDARAGARAACEPWLRAVPGHASLGAARPAAAPD